MQRKSIAMPGLMRVGVQAPRRCSENSTIWNALWSGILSDKKSRNGTRTDIELFERNLIRDLIFISETIKSKLLKKNAERGHSRISMAFAPVLLHIAKSGSRAIDIAARTNLSKQAIGKTVRSLEELGYVKQEISGDDARARYLKFTAKGVKLIRDTGIGIDEVTRDIERLIGKEKAHDFIDTVALLVDRLQEEDSV